MIQNLEEKKTILVPVDFTVVAITALNHANHVSKLLGKTVTLLHVVEKESERAEAFQKLKTIADDNLKKNNIETTPLVYVGSFFTEIGKAADDVVAALVVMGTHGVKGLQKIMGSYALRVITNSNAPYIVVQKKPFAEHGYKNILLPMDFTREAKQKLAWAVFIAKIFNSKCHLLAEYQGDEFLANKIKNNIYYSEAVLRDNDVEDVTVHQLPKGSGDFDKATIKYAREINADLIVVMTTLDKGLSEYIAGPYEQRIIANEAEIPVLVIKPIDITNMIEGFSIMSFGS